MYAYACSAPAHIAGLFLGLVVCFAQTIKPNQIEDADGLRTDQEDPSWRDSRTDKILIDSYTDKTLSDFKNS